MKFVMSQAICTEGLELLKGKAEVAIADNGDPGNYSAMMADADAFILRIGRCDARAIESAKKLRVIGRTGVGYDTVDVKKATELGIPVVITPGANNRSVAEHTIAMIFALSKNLVEGHEQTILGNWEIRNAHKAFELEGKSIGILGLGAIGCEVARISKALGLRILGYDPFLPKDKIESLGAKPCSDYNEMLEKSDVVSIHIPLNDATRNMIASEQLSRMKSTAILVNCSRGGIVNEADLCRALENRQIAGAGIDVFCEEPPKPGNPLFNAPNLIVSPHSAAQSREAVIKMASRCVEGCLAVLRGEKWPFVADANVYNHPRWR